MTLEVVYNIFSLRNSWNELVKGNSDLTPFQYYDYNRNLYIDRWFNIVSKRTIPIFLVVYDEGNVIMIAPLKKTVRNCYFMLGDIQGCGVTDFIYKKTTSKDLLYQGIDLILNYCKKINIGRICENSPVYKYFLERVNGCGEMTDTLVNIPLPSSYDEYFSLLSKHSRQNIRTSYNRINKDNINLSLKILQSGEITIKDWKAINAIYTKRQHETYNAGGFGLKLKNLFLKHDSMSLRYNSNAFIGILLYNDSPVAVLMGLKTTSENKLVVPRLAIDASYSHYSPGNQLINECIRYLIEKTEVRNLDLSRGTEKYKYVMGGVEYYTKNFILV